MTNSNFINSEILVDSEWLSNHLDDPNLRIVDCDLVDSYERSHIKGAIGISVHHYIKHPSYPDNPKEFPWVAVKYNNGSIDQIQFGLKKLSDRTWEFDISKIQNVKTIGFAASNKAGESDVLVTNY